MIRLSFSEEEVKELDYQRYHHPHPRVQKKMEVLLLKARGLSTEQIAHCVGICQNTVRSYLREYESGAGQSHLNKGSGKIGSKTVGRSDGTAERIGSSKSFLIIKGSKGRENQGA